MPDANECPNCKTALARIAVLEARVASLQADNAKLCAFVEELRRSGKRQAAPFSKGSPKPDPKPPGRKPGDSYGRNAHRPPPSEAV